MDLKKEIFDFSNAGYIFVHCFTAHSRPSSWRRRGLVLGLSGATCSGKTTLAAQLVQQHFPNARVLSQDDFYYPDDSPEHTRIPELDHVNWDRVDAVDMAAFRREIQTYLSTAFSGSGEEGPPLLILDGITIFNDVATAKLCDVKYFFTLDRNECLARRSRRSYDPPDVPGYFELTAWPQYLANLRELEQAGMIGEADGRIRFLDGALSLNERCKIIRDEVLRQCERSSL